ncbi:hypothetical protein KUCAC02_034268, partial [Chaenocephalus aceratus]
GRRAGTSDAFREETLEAAGWGGKTEAFWEKRDLALHLAVTGRSGSRRGVQLLPLIKPGPSSRPSTPNKPCLTESYGPRGAVCVREKLDLSAPTSASRSLRPDQKRQDVTSYVTPRPEEVLQKKT